MIELYDFKLIKSGKEIEVYKYKTKKILKGYTRKKNRTEEEKERDKEKRIQKKQKETEYMELVEIWGDKQEVAQLHKEQNLKTTFSISRTRTNIRRLTNANPHLRKFLTLTFAENMPYLSEANKLFNTALKRILRAKPAFEYIAVVEFQKDVDYHGNIKPLGGSVHYHLLCNIAVPDNMTLSDIFAWERRFALKYWKNGFVKIKDVKTVTNMGAYFCKYLGKDMFDKRMFGKKKFFCSQSLKKPVEMTGNEAMVFFNRFVKPTLKPIFEKTFTSEYTGKVEYSAYSLNADSVNFEHMLSWEKNNQLCKSRNTMLLSSKDCIKKYTTSN